LLANFHPEMVFLADLGVNLHVCLCGDLQVASPRKRLIPLIWGKPDLPGNKGLSTRRVRRTGTRPAGVGLSTPRV